MNLDDLLHDALHDNRWALPVSPDILTVVRRKRSQRRRTQAVGAVLMTAALVSGVAVVATQVGGSQRSSLQVGSGTAAGGCDVAPPSEPIPGSTPAYPIASARDWFMTKTQSDAFFRGYVVGDRVRDGAVPSPQASGPGTDRLVAELTAAGVPGAASLERDEAASGRPGSLVLTGRLPDGDSLYVGRGHALYPIDIDTIAGPFPDTVSVEDVPGTACAAFIYLGLPNVPGGHGVQVLAPDGTSTGWTSETIPIAQLKAWAYAAARWATAHPAG